MQTIQNTVRFVSSFRNSKTEEMGSVQLVITRTIYLSSLSNEVKLFDDVIDETTRLNFIQEIDKSKN